IEDPQFEVPTTTSTSEVRVEWQPAAEPLPEGMQILVSAPPAESQRTVEAEEARDSDPLPQLASGTALVGQLRSIYRGATSPVMASLLVHAVVVFLAASITVATFDQNAGQFASVVLDLSHEPVEKSESFDPGKLADLSEADIHDAMTDVPRMNSLAAVDQPPIPVDFKSIDGPLSSGRAGIPSALRTDLGALMTGVGGVAVDGHGVATGLGDGNSIGGGKGGARTGNAQNERKGTRSDSTLFFGTEARGNRFVFIVDNSSSMKGGRLQMAVTELIRTIEGLTVRQSFYVIFVSDQTYPMFYPQQEPSLVPATAVNKKRLAEWAPKAILASGKNRELIKAMDMAAALRPQAVYLLWDGDLRYSEKVRLDVLTHLTQPGWNFIVHTLGMGITSRDSEQNLRMIAQAHHGIYRRIDVPKTPAR
ncbi:MAG TPA: hypothetical protein VFW73_04305, partial [Lacipirellulaceae bacterium]|nr:hypothetical protein [Lacipirellulaceae bacterium]